MVAKQKEKFRSGIYGIARSATLVVAASDALSNTRLYADYICNGIDDDVQIQEAIDALPAGGGRVVLSEGTFTLATEVTLATLTTLQGQGATTVLTSGSISGLIQTSGTTNNVTLSDMYLDIENLANGGNGARFDGNASYVTVERVVFDGNDDGETMDALDLRAHNSVVRDCLLTNMGALTQPIFCNSLSGALITGNRVYHKYYGVYLGAVACDHVVISSNYFYSAGNANSVAVYRDSSYVTVANNVIEGTSESHAGIACSQAHHVTVTGNTVTDHTASAEGGIEIEVNSAHGSGNDTTDIVVSGNVVNNCTRGIYTRRAAGSDDVKRVMIANNVVTGCTTGLDIQGESGFGAVNTSGNSFEGNTTDVARSVNVPGRDSNNMGVDASGDVFSISLVIDHAALTDNVGQATAYIDFAETIPAGSIIKAVKCDFTEAWNSDDTSTLTFMIGIPTDLDGFSKTSTPGDAAFNHTTDVFWGESACQDPVVVAAVVPRVTFTEDDDGTDIINSTNAAGGVTITITYMKT